MNYESDITAIRKGSIESFRPFFEKYTLILRRYALKYIQNEDVVKDIVQETMVRFWERRRKFDDMSAAISFLFVTTKNALFDEIRHKKVVSAFVTNSLNGTSEIQNDFQLYDEEAKLHLYRRLEAEVANLPRRTQEIIRLKLAGFQMMEIAEILDVDRETVKTLQRSGMEKLSKVMLPLQEFYFAHLDDIYL